MTSTTYTHNKTRTYAGNHTLVITSNLSGSRWKAAVYHNDSRRALYVESFRGDEAKACAISAGMDMLRQYETQVELTDGEMGG